MSLKDIKFYLQGLTYCHCLNELLAAVVTRTRPSQNHVSQNYSMKISEKTEQVKVPLDQSGNISLISESHILGEEN